MRNKLILTEAEREEIFNMHKKHGYKQPLNEQPTLNSPKVMALFTTIYSKLKPMGYVVTTDTNGDKLIRNTKNDGFTYPEMWFAVGDGESDTPQVILTKKGEKSKAFYGIADVQRHMEEIMIFMKDASKPYKAKPGENISEDIKISTVQEPSADVAEDVDMGQEERATPASKVEDIVNGDPRFQSKIDAIIGALSDEDMAQLQSALEANGIDANSSAEEIHSVIEQPQEGEQEMGENMGHDPKKQIKHKVANILHSVGAGNVAAWGGVPAAMVIGSMTGMPLGFAISWGATAVLMAIAKKLNQNVEKDSMYESKNTLNEGLADEAYEFTASSKRISQSLEMLHSFAKQGNMRGANDEKEVLMKHIRRAEYALDAIKRMLR